MRPLYYIILKDNPTQQLTFDNKSVQEFLINKRQDDPEKNDVVFHNFGFKIEYNTYTGSIKLSDVNINKEINVTFSVDAFKAELIPIEEAISWRAKHDLIAKLYSLNDPDINEIIKMNKLEFGEDAQASHNSHTKLTKTLLQIQSHVKPAQDRIFKGFLFSPKQSPIQQAIYLGLKEHGGIDQIKSAKDVEKIMHTIKTEIKKREPHHQEQVQRKKRF